MNTKFSVARGYSLLEALVALLLVVLGLYAAITMQSKILQGSGEAKSRSKATAIAQANLEAARSIAARGDYDAIATACAAASPDSAFTVGCTVTVPAGGLDQRLVQITVSWVDTTGTKNVTLDSLVGWENVASFVVGVNAQAQPSIAPLGRARVGIGQYSPLPDGRTQNGDGTSTNRRDDGRIELIDEATGNILLYIDRVNDQDQSFVRIMGNIYFDQSAGNSLPAPSDVRVRLSSEGLCIYNNALVDLLSASGGSNSYSYFPYTCYVGAGWYGNVGVTIDGDVSGQAGSPTICLGDPAFNNGESNGTLTSAHTREASVRTFRGFRASGQSYLSTGMQNGSTYPSSSTPGSPTPSQYSSFYPTYTNNYFNHHFLLTRIQGNADSCQAKMEGGVFTQNAGKYFCIAPDEDPAADACPSVWPGFESEVGNGGSLNYSMTVAKSGGGDGLIESVPASISCGTICSASFASGTSVTLTATPSAGSTLSSWSGCDSTSGNTCTATMTGARSVTVTFTGSSTTYALGVTNTGTGSGTVVSDTGGINCGATCSATYQAGTTVTLTATAASGSTFAGWSGACSGTGACTVTLSQARNVTATFTNSAPVACNVQITGTRIDQQGTIALVSPIGAGGCTGDNNTGNYQCNVSVSLNPSATVQLRNYRTNGNPTYDHYKNVSVTSCGSITNVNFP